jgi:hypothetical protein
VAGRAVIMVTTAFWCMAASMERRSFETPLGEVCLWGEWPHSTLPLVFVIHGANARLRPSLHTLQQYVEGVEVVCAHLAGNHCPELRQPGIAAMAQAYSATLMADFPARPVLVIGESAGALVGLGMKAPGLRGRVLLEPPLVTSGLGEVSDVLRPIVGAVEDYRSLLSTLDTPALVLAGDRKTRSADGSGTLVSDQDRAAMIANPRIRFVVVRGAGHNMIADAPDEMLRAITGAVGNFVSSLSAPASPT